MKSPWSLLRPHTGRLVGVVALSGLAAAGESLGLALFSVLLNQVVDSRSGGSAWGILGALQRLMNTSPQLFFLLLAATYIGKSLLTLLANWSAIVVALGISDGWRMRLLRGLMKVPLRVIPPRQGVTLQLILDEPNIAGYGLASGGLLIQNLFSVATIYATLAWLSPKTTAMLTGVALAAFVVLTQVFRYSRTVGRQRSEAFTEGFGYLTEMLSALRQVRLFGLENQVEARAAE